ncbi:MAG: bacillithiol biosynthesis cysteine-adding enzyme BshC [Bacteroidota bacterium]|nr:bacillithiol biosynthesis cysteine-adding enzyme BshC [Bacteroidota bacterium]
MKHSKILLSETGLVPPIVLDYLAGNEFLKPFYAEPNTIGAYKKLIDARNFDEKKRQVLYDSLINQFHKIKLPLENYPILYSNIKLLLDSNTYTICTGHQLCLYGGPMFVTYKILTAIKLCSELRNAYPEINFVPVLWLASEDHDFEEISNTHLYGRDFKWHKDSGNKPVGTLDLEGLSEDIETISKLIGTNETGQRWIKLIEDSYLKSNDLSEATIKLYTDIFKDYGLIVLEPNQKIFKEELIPVIKSDLLDQSNFSVQTKSDKLLAEKYKLQINARETNFFYLSETSGRRQIKKEGEAFVIAGTETRFSVQQLAVEINNYPERFSPNVNLRPVYQELILPNLAYIGGPAEIAYWLQLKAIFDVNKIKFPSVVLRSMNLITGSQLIEKVEKYGLTVSDLVGNELKLTQAYLQKGRKFDFQKSFDIILNEFQILIDASKDLNKEVSKNFLETKLSLKNLFHEKQRDIKRSIGEAETEQIEKLMKLRSKLYPKGIFQERTDTLFQHESNLNRILIPEILEQIDIFHPALNVFSL